MGPTTTCTAPSPIRNTPREPSAVSAASSMQARIVQHQAQARGAGLDAAQIRRLPQAANPVEPQARSADSGGYRGNRGTFGFAAQRFQIEAHDAVTEQEVVQREVGEADRNQQQAAASPANS